MNLEPHCIIAGEEGFKSQLLDAYLAAGYYRMQHLLFTCNDTQVSEDGYSIPVFWLRTLVYNVQQQKQAKNIIKKCSEFTVARKKASVTAEIENLYQIYRNHVPFSTSATCANYLHQAEIENPFDSWMIEVRHNQTLIAVGYFDKGHEAIAGIMNIYHPNYQQYSLGKYLILQKLSYALNNNILFYYTGYISTASTRFDYKTFPDAKSVEVFLPVEKKWLPYSYLGKEFLHDYYLDYLI